MKRKILSIVLAMALIMSVFTALPVITSAEATNDIFSPYKKAVDFTQYVVNSGAANIGNTINQNGDWQIVSKDDGTGDKYLQFTKNSNTFSENSLSHKVQATFIANPTGDVDWHGGSYEDYQINLKKLSTSYRIKVTYKIEGLDSDKYDMNFMVGVTGGTNKLTAYADSFKVVSRGFNNTDGDWATTEFVYKTLDKYDEENTAEVSKKRASMYLGLVPVLKGTDNLPVNTELSYTVAYDYVSVEELEDNPESIHVDFNNYEVTEYDSANFSGSVAPGAYWEKTSENGETFLRYATVDHMAHTSSSGATNFAFAVNPTGAAEYDKAKEIYRLETGSTYRITLRYKLTTDADMTISLKIAQSLSNYHIYSLKFLSVPGSSGGNTAAVFPPSDDWQNFEFTFNADEDFVSSQSKVRGLVFSCIPSVRTDVDFTFDIDDIIVDRLSAVTLDYGGGLTETLLGAPAAAIDNRIGFGRNNPETFVPKSAAENINGATAQAIKYDWYEDSGLTVPANDLIFKGTDTTIYAKPNILISDENQAAFTGFDEYKTREESSWAGSASDCYTKNGWLSASDNTTLWEIVNLDDAFSGERAMSLTLNNGGTSDYANSKLYIGNGYEFEKNTTYHISARIKRNPEVDSNATLNVYIGQGYNHLDSNGNSFSDYDYKTLNVSDLDDWTEITFRYNASDGDEKYAAPLLRFVATEYAKIYIDTVIISKVCSMEGSNVVASTTEGAKALRIIASYKNSNPEGAEEKITLAGKEYKIIERGIHAKNTNTVADLEAGGVGVFEIAKTSNFGNYYADGENGEKQFSMLLEDLPENDTRQIQAKAYIKLEDGQKYFSEILTIDLGGNVYVPENYQLVWGDEFDGTALDEQKWTKAAYGQDYTPAGNNGGEVLTWPSEDVLNVTGGNLVLKTIEYTAADPSLSAVKYKTSGGITTRDKMSFKYGYAEIRARISFTDGMGYAIWLKSLKQDSDTMAEVDVIEGMGNGNIITANIHKWEEGGHSQYNSYHPTQQYNISQNNDDVDAFVNDYHIFGYEWSEQSIKCYIDGVLFAEFDTTQDYETSGQEVGDMAAFNDPMIFLFGVNPHYSLGDWDDYGFNDESELPFIMEIDYVRLYQDANGINVTTH